MLNGIGGRTITEAKENLTEEEFLSWVAYRERFGSLNPIVAIDRGCGTTSFLIQAVNGGKGNYLDFVPDYRTEEQKAHDELQQAMKEWK